MKQPSLAVIGTGAAGMACGHFLHDKFDLTFYEQNDYIGGHANTATIQDGDETVYSDTAFVIFNDDNYPLFNRLLKELNVPTIRCPMSFSFKIVPAGWEYNTKGMTYLPTNLRNLLDRRFRKMLSETGRFYKEATEIYKEEKYHNLSIAEYVEEKGYSDDFINNYLIPIIAVVWSIPDRDMLDYPALTMIEFLDNHGAFQGIFGRKRWSTVANGSRSYRDRLIAPFKEKIRTGCAATQIKRKGEQVEVTDNTGQTTTFDHVIVACHADQALRILANPTALEQELLGQFRYSTSTVTLHTDSSIMPKKRRLWAGWNYLVDKDDSGAIQSSFSYYMNKLQNVSDKKDYFVTVNDRGWVDPAKILRTYEYEHPVFDSHAIAAQPKLARLNENGRLYFCGSYFKYGFHEDAFRSGVEVCRAITGTTIWED